MATKKEDPWPAGHQVGLMTVYDTADAGRGLVATDDIGAGSVVCEFNFGSKREGRSDTHVRVGWDRQCDLFHLTDTGRAWWRWFMFDRSGDAGLVPASGGPGAHG